MDKKSGTTEGNQNRGGDRAHNRNNRGGDKNDDKSDNKRPPRQQRPEEIANRAEQDKESASIQALTDKIRALETSISGKSHGKEEYQRKKEDLLAKIREQSGEIDKIETNKKKIQEIIYGKQDEAKKQRSEANDVKKKMQYTNEKEIDTKIAEIEYKMQISSLTLNEEKKLLAELSALRKQRPLVCKAAASANNKTTAVDDSAALGQLRMQLETMGKELNTLYTNKKTISAQLKVLTEGRKEATGDVRELFEEKDALKTQLSAHFQKRAQLREDLDALRKVWSVEDAQSKVKRLDRQRAQRKVYDQEKTKRDLERALDQEENEPPLMNDITVVQQTLQYIKRMCNMTDDSKEEKKSEDKPAAVIGSNMGKGQLKKDDPDVDFFFGSLSDKYEKKLNKKKKNMVTNNNTHNDQKNLHLLEEEKDKKLIHSLGILATFEEIGISPPFIMGDCSATFAALEQRLSSLLQKQKELMAGSTDRAAEIKSKLDAHLEEMNQTKALLD